MTEDLTKQEILERLQQLFAPYNRHTMENPKEWEWPDRGSEYKVYELINEIREDLDKEPI